MSLDLDGPAFPRVHEYLHPGCRLCAVQDFARILQDRLAEGLQAVTAVTARLTGAAGLYSTAAQQAEKSE
ncbi:MAG TPA: hypothetical protein DDY78_08065 [Planctomycetales bacterium]|nr:hypothetical protein [Planctomycetales bacterium]